MSMLFPHTKRLETLILINKILDNQVADHMLQQEQEA